MKKVKIELTTKEAYLLWVVACWFSRPNWFITSTLINKLYDASQCKDTEKFNKKYRSTELERFVDIGQWVAEFHPELLTKDK
jgi:hypothetical protein